jgi:hypothetical protein
MDPQGQYRTTPPTLVDQQVSQLMLDASGNLKVVNGSSGATATQVQGNIANDVVDAGNPVKVGGVGSSTVPTAVTAGNRVNAWFSLRGAIATFFTDVTGAIISFITAGADGASDTRNSVPTMSRLEVYNGATWDRLRGSTVGANVVPTPNTTGGLSQARVVTGTSGNIKASAGQVFALTVYNVNAAVRYLHLYNKATAPTVGTDTPVMTIPMLGASVRDITLNDHGSAFSLGISWAYTTDDIAIPATVGTSTELHFTAQYK